MLLLFQADGFGSFNKTVTKNVHLIDVDQSFPVLAAPLTCPSGDAGVFITAVVKAKIDAEVGFIATGRLIPPRIDHLAFITSQ